MALDKIKQLLESCKVQELYELEKHIDHLIQEAEKQAREICESKERERRREERFDMNLLGTLTRITDVKPGERKEYSVTIQDVSRGGMRLKLEHNFIPSRVVEVTFASPGGKIKRCFLEIVRMVKNTNQDGSWLEVGCRSINNDEVRRLRLQEEQVSRIRSKLHNRSGIMVMIVGSDADENKQRTVNRLKNHGFSTRQVDSLHVAMQSGEKINAQLAIICNGSQLCTDSRQLEVLKNKPQCMAVMAIVHRQEDIMPLVIAGVDECLTEENYDNYLFPSIERAILGHAVRRGRNQKRLSGCAMVVSHDSKRLNLVAYQLEENGYNYNKVTGQEELAACSHRPCDLVLVDYCPSDKEDFKEVLAQYTNTPVVAMCEDLADGHSAIADGAANYLCMPPSKEDIKMILELTGAKLNAQM